MTSALHLYDCAGVAASLTTAMFNRGEVGVSFQLTDADIFKFSDVYLSQILMDGTIEDMITVGAESRDKFDIVHLHFFWNYLPIVRKMFPEQKIVMHYHGSDVRGANTKIRNNCERIADQIFIATDDLFDYEYASKPYHLRTPIDLGFFNSVRPHTPLKFAILRSQNDPARFNARLEELEIQGVRILDREHEFRYYKEQPQFYSRYGTYVDIKYDRVKKDWIDSLSKTALECLASNLDVIDVNGHLLTEFPMEHSLNFVCGEMLEIYNTL